MTTSSTNSLGRVFRAKEFLRGAARSVVVWSGLSSVLLCLLLADLFLIADLLETRGRVDVAALELETFQQLTGALSRKRLQGALGPGDAAAGVRLENEGLRPTVWRLRHVPWMRPLATVYRRLPWLRHNWGALVTLILVAAGMVLLRNFAVTRAKRQSVRLALERANQLRRNLHRQALRLGPSDLTETATSEALALFSDQTNRVREGMSRWVYTLACDPLKLLLLAALALSVDWWVALQCLIPLSFGWYLVQCGKQRLELNRQLEQSRAESELRVLSESFRKTRIVRGYGMENFEHEQFQKHLDRFHDQVASVLRREHRWQMALGAVGAICLALVLFFVGSKVLKPLAVPDRMSLSTAMLLLATFGCMALPLQALWRLSAERSKASLAADRIYRYLNRIPEVGQAVGAKFLQPLAKSLQFEAVTYSLPQGHRLLDGVDLRIAAGETVAVVSLDPLEPQALAYLLPRFLEPQSGRILFDGNDIAWVTLESLRAETVYVGGTDPFFTGTVRDNISCGQPEYSLQDVTEAAKTTHAHHFILKLPQGYETVLGEHGERLEPGEGFRLGLARAMLRNPALVIIEEPNPPLDDDTKSLLEDAYQRITRNRTVIFLPRRLSTLRNADRIVLLHRGTVEAIGPQTELVKTSELYRHWEYLRFNVFRHELEPVT